MNESLPVKAEITKTNAPRPWLLTVYLLTVSITAFVLPASVKVFGVILFLAAQLLLFAVAGKLNSGVFRAVSRLRVLFAFLLLCYALLPGGANDQYLATPIPGLHVNLTGLALAATMCAQISLVVLASMFVRTVGDSSAFVEGLKHFRVTPLLAYSLDLTFAILDGTVGADARASGGGSMGGGGGGGRGGRGGGGGRGRGMGGGRGMQPDERHAGAAPADYRTDTSPQPSEAGVPTDPAPQPQKGVLEILRTGDLSPLFDKIRQALSAGRDRAVRYGLDPRLAADVGVIGGVGAVMMSFKMLKILPGLPFFSGHKTVFFIPLYIVAAHLTHSRFGATVAGTIMGFVGFLNGDGRYGIFEILKHLAPGLCVDLLWPAVRRMPRRIWVYNLFGVVVAGARSTTEFALLLALGGRGELVVFPLFTLVPNLIAGFLSGFVTYALVKNLDSWSADDAPPPADRNMNLPMRHESRIPSVLPTEQATADLAVKGNGRMSNIVQEGLDPRAHIDSPLMRESLVSKRVTKSSATENELRILPDVNVISIGGLSIMDRGKGALLPLTDAIVAARKTHKIILGVGGGARLRHTYHICLDLGIPTGGLAMVAGAVDEQNTRILQSVLAKHNGITLNKDHFLDLPLWLESGMIPIMTGMPPYHYWEPPSGKNRVPANGHDLGVYMISEVLGARSMIFVKDEDGLYSANPKTDKNAQFIPKIGVRDLLARKLPDLIVEHALLETMLNARHTRKVQIINGLKPHLIARALAGEHVGTIIDADL